MFTIDKSRFMRACVIAAASVFTTFSTLAAETEEAKGPKSETSAEMSDLKLATELVRHGYASKSALTLADALTLLADLKPGQSTQRTSETTNSGSTTTDPKKVDMTLDFNKILTDAKDFAKGDKNMLAVLDQIEKDYKGQSRGRYQGPGYSCTRVNANSSYSFVDRFTANRVAEVLVVGDGDTDLDLYIYDMNGNLICKDVSYDRDAYASFIPYYTTNFKMKIVNRGSVYNNFCISTN